MRILRTILPAIIQLFAAAAIIISFQPCVALLIGKEIERPYSYYEDVYFDYFVMRSLLIALAGVGTGSILIWISGRIKPKAARGLEPTRERFFSGKRMGVAASLVAAAIL